jgi:hypothetical protein
MELLTNIIRALFPQKVPQILQTYSITRSVTDDRWNHKPNSDVTCYVMNDQDTCIAEFNYRTTVGQVGWIWVSDQDRSLLLVEQILIYMMKEMQQAGATHIWEAKPKENVKCFLYIRPLYSNLWDFRYVAEKVHPTVTGGGYIMEIPQNINLLQITTNHC